MSSSRHYKSKPTDHQLSELAKENLPDSDLYNRLHEGERRLDTVITRKWLDLQDMIGRSMRRNKVLRIFVSSAVNNQLWQNGGFESSAFDFGLPNSSEPPTWSLRVEGRLVDEDPESHRLFSSMFTSIIVELTSVNSQGEEATEVVEWHEVSPHSTDPHIDFDGLDIQRRGDTVVKAKITMQLKEYPDKFKLSPQLADVLGITEESKPGVVVSLWQYMRFHKLQDVDEKRLIRCDAALKSLFGRDTLTFPEFFELLSPHLKPRDPITIDYVIDPTQELPNRDVAYDVHLQVEDPLRQELITMLDSWYQNQGAVQTLDEQSSNDVQKINLLAEQREFYEKLVEDPAKFIQKWISSQAQDLKIIYSDRQFSEEAVRHSSFYSDEVLNQSIHLFLNKQ